MSNYFGRGQKRVLEKAQLFQKTVPRALFCMTVTLVGLGKDRKFWVNLHFLHIFTLSLGGCNLFYVMKPHRTFYWFKALRDTPRKDREWMGLSGQTLFAKPISPPQVIVPTHCWRVNPPFLPSLPNKASWRSPSLFPSSLPTQLCIMVTLLWLLEGRSLLP